MNFKYGNVVNALTNKFFIVDLLHANDWEKCHPTSMHCMFFDLVWFHLTEIILRIKEFPGKALCFLELPTRWISHQCLIKVDWRPLESFFVELVKFYKLTRLHTALCDYRAMGKWLFICDWLLKKIFDKAVTFCDS